MVKRAHDLKWTIPRPGESVAGKYVVEGLCGRGGLAAVLSAMHVGLDQRVAIKMLLPEWSDEPHVVERFLREGRAATRIRSEHVVRVFDVGSLESGAPYLVLEFLEGHNLDDVVGMWGPLPVPTTIDWVLQAAEAIAEAHSYGIVHRDLKPANLFLTRRADGSACIKVLDFGLSKLTDPNMEGAASKLTREHDVLGSPHYMAPEQLRATRDADTPADVWALGAVLHELLTGTTPFRGETMPELCATVLTQPAPPLSSLRSNVPPEVEAAVLRCLEKEPAARFANLAELARAIVPFGTSAARESCARIERVLEGGDARTSELSLPPMSTEEPARISDWPSDAHDPPRRGVASLRPVFGALLLLSGMGAAALMWMYASVHAQEPPPRVGATAPQPRASAPTPRTSASTAEAQEPPRPSSSGVTTDPQPEHDPAPSPSHTRATPVPRSSRTPAPARATPSRPPAELPRSRVPPPAPAVRASSPPALPRHDNPQPPPQSAPVPAANDPFSGRK
jgi:serine/threonine-protein kinase